MFLANGTSKAVVEGLEQNSVLVNLLWSLGGVLVSSLFWGMRYRRETRAAATFGFYTQFRRILTELQRLFDQFNCTNENPFCLLYTQYLRENYDSELRIPFGSAENCVAKFKKSAEEIQKILSETTNNVYPSWSKKRKWYQKQQVLYDFAQMIVDDLSRNIENSYSSKHIEKWKELQAAVNYLAKKIDRAVF